MRDDWQDNWEVFVDAVADSLRSGATPEALARHFGGKKVRWTGVLDEKNIDELAALVGIALPEKHLDLGQGRMTTLDGVSLPLATHYVADWNKLEVGTPVTFTATLGSATSTFPPIELKHLKSGRCVVMIRLTDAIPM